MGNLHFIGLHKQHLKDCLFAFRALTQDRRLEWKIAAQNWQLND